MLSSHTCLLIGILTLGIHFSGPAVCFPVKKDWSSADIIDSYNSMTVYDNGRMSNFFGRNLSREGYNLGLKYQCVEFVKRYYYQIKNHRMPDSYGHAYMLFDSSLSNGHHNEDRNLTQYMNGSVSKPPIGDILFVFQPTPTTDALKISRNPPPQTRPMVRTIYYKIRTGDSLSKIAARFNTSVSAIKTWNPTLTQKPYLHPGDRLRLELNVRNSQGT